MTTAHTETPWQQNDRKPLQICDASDEIGCAPIATFKRKEDAAFCVRACNAHDDLVKALAEAKDALFCGSPVTVGLENQINAALAKAKGGAA